MAGRRFLIALGLTLIAIGLLGVVGLGMHWTVNRPHQHSAAAKIVTIEPGLGTRRIVSKLAEEGIVSSPNVTLAWLMLTGRSKKLKAGDYEFPSPISSADALDKLARGEVATRRVTVPEGLNRFEVAALLAEKTGLGSQEKFLALTASPDLIKDLDPQAASLEGYLFPDTYEYIRRSTPEELIGQMTDRFREIWKPEWTQLAAARSLTVHQAVTMASMVEKEARIDEERPVIASVFYNRLKQGMVLASDPTFIYAAILENDYDGDVNHPRHRRRVSPFNTYLFAGLPPAPIASPGRKAIEAVIFPAETDYYYFVVSGTQGHHKFSRTAEEHDAAVAEYRKQQARDN